MTNPQLLEYVRQQLSAGFSKDDIKQNVLTAGWPAEDVDAAFAAIDAPLPPPSAAPVDPKNKRKSFTRFKLLLIPIAGILVCVVLFSLYYNARQKGGDAVVIADMSSLIMQGTVYKNQSNSYQGFCESVQVTSQLQEASKIGAQTPSAFVCNDTAQHWAASVKLRSAGYACIDDSGAKTTLASALRAQSSCTGNSAQASSTPQ